MPFFKYLILSTLFAVLSHATVYEVGPGKPYTKIGSVPWATLAPGDTVLIYWRSTPYYEKWAIGTSGTAAAPITVRGVMNSSSRPIIDGQNAITPANLRYTNPERSVLKIGGTSVPADIAPQYIVIENLEFRKAHTGYNFTNFDGSTVGYVANAASIHVE